MIKEFVNKFMESKPHLKEQFSLEHPGGYKDIVKAVVSVLANEDGYSWDQPDPERIHEIDDGDYQGTLVYVIAAKDYQPHEYWYVRISYGSCSGCDTLEAIRGYSDEKPTEDQVKQYMTLALHVVQEMKRMDGEAV